MNAVLRTRAASRAIVLRTRGSKHGPITRLVSPSDIGELIKPFVFLDLFDIPAMGTPTFGWHPHSGIATLGGLSIWRGTFKKTTGTFNRADFGVNYGQGYGFKQDVPLRIQVEGIKVN